MMTSILVLVLSYLLGAIPFALILGKHFHNIDLREHGSGNLGTTNAIRILGKKTGFAVLFLDIGKGALAAALPLLLDSSIHILIAGGLAIIGHAFSVFIKFKGGKSVATTAGVFLILSPPLFLIGIITFLFILFTTKYVSLSSILTSVILALFSFFLLDSLIISLCICAIALFITIKHTKNIKRIFNKTEPKAFQK